MNDSIEDEFGYSGVTIDIDISGYSEEQWSEFHYNISVCDENDDRKTIGKGQGRILDNPSGYDELVWIADDIDQWIYDTCSSLDHSLCEPAIAHHVVFIESMELERKYRSRGLGIMTMNYLLNFFKGDLILIVPCPLIGTYSEEDEEKITEKLRHHWMKCGFKQLKNGDIFYYSSQKDTKI
jgi:hypothetical protein